MKRMYNLRIDAETESKIETLKTVYGIKTTSKLLRSMIDMHFRFWTEMGKQSNRAEIGAKSEMTVDEAKMTPNACTGCIHHDACGYLDPELNDYEWDEEKKFEEHCVGCCCGDGFECNKDCGCDNYEDGTLPILG